MAEYAVLVLRSSRGLVMHQRQGAVAKLTARDAMLEAAAQCGVVGGAPWWWLGPSGGYVFALARILTHIKGHATRRKDLC